MKAARQRNNRWSPRRSLRWNVAISEQGNAVGATVRNISIGGVRVDVDGTVLTPNAVVHIWFPGTTSPEHSFKANVVWAGRGRAGLMFSDYSPEVLRALRDVIGHSAAKADMTTKEENRVSVSDGQLDEQ